MSLASMKRELQQLKTRVGNKHLCSIPHLQPDGMSLEEWERVIAEHKPDGRRHFWVSFIEPKKDRLSGNQS
jgi:hypothetical protein